MILFSTETHRVGVIDDAGRPKLLTREQFDALARISRLPVTRRVADSDLDELFRANGVCIPRAQS